MQHQPPNPQQANRWQLGSTCCIAGIDNYDHRQLGTTDQKACVTHNVIIVL
jgi:hypothetical protein